MFRYGASSGFWCSAFRTTFRTAFRPCFSKPARLGRASKVTLFREAWTFSGATCRTPFSDRLPDLFLEARTARADPKKDPKTVPFPPGRPPFRTRTTKKGRFGQVQNEVLIYGASVLQNSGLLAVKPTNQRRCTLS